MPLINELKNNNKKNKIMKKKHKIIFSICYVIFNVFLPVLADQFLIFRDLIFGGPVATFKKPPTTLINPLFEPLISAILSVFFFFFYLALTLLSYGLLPKKFQVSIFFTAVATGIFLFEAAIYFFDPLANLWVIILLFLLFSRYVLSGIALIFGVIYLIGKKEEEEEELS